MTREELRTFLDKFACGCGSPEDASKALLDVLDTYAVDGPDGYKRAWSLEQWPSEGHHWLFLYLLDSTGLLEHGSTVRCSWLTPLGEGVREALRREAEDGFRSLETVGDGD